MFESEGLFFLFIVIDIVLGISVLLDFFYFQKVDGRKIRKPRFRYTYYLGCLVNDLRELGWFKKYFNVSTPAFLLMFGKDKALALSNIEDWGYLVGEDYVNYINAYNEKYSDYRDYVNLDKQWNLCGELLEIINSGRAYDVQGALSVIDTRRHRASVEAYAASQAAAAQSAASAAWAAADAEKDIAKNEAEQTKILEQLKNQLS
jgi:hypothetical protein